MFVVNFHRINTHAVAELEEEAHMASLRGRGGGRRCIGDDLFFLSLQLRTVGSKGFLRGVFACLRA